MRSVDEDRHRVASQLHDQAIFSFVGLRVDDPHRVRRPARRPSRAGRGVGPGARRPGRAGRGPAPAHAGGAAARARRGPAAQAARLASPIRAYVDSLSGDTSHPTLEISVDDDVHVDWTTETILLRIVQEAVGNTVRHANAQTLRVTVAAEDGLLGVTVSDDGDGFDPDGRAPRVGAGDDAQLRRPRRRTSLHVESRPGEGTTVRVRFGDDADDRSEATGADATQRGPPTPDARPDPGPA